MDRQAINKAFGVTDKQLDKMAEEYESGEWTGGIGPVIASQPRICDKKTATPNRTPEKTKQ